MAQHPKLADFPNQEGLRPIPRYACKMATGSGKTVVMAMLIAWAFCNRGATPGDPRFPRRVLVICPNLTIKERLRVLRPAAPGNYYEGFDIVPSPLRPELAKGKVLVTNWHRLSPESEVIRVGTVKVGRIGEETPEAFARGRLGDLWDDEPLLVLNDEGHHAYRPAPVAEAEQLTAQERAEREAATVWVGRTRPDQRGLWNRHLRRPVRHAVLHPRAAVIRKDRRFPGSSATSALSTQSSVGSPRSHASLPATTPVAPIRNISNCGST